MKRVYKYFLPLGNGFVWMPAGAQILKVAPRGHAWNMWALVDTDDVQVNREFVVRGTGEDVREKDSYIDTFFDGELVWHMFEVIE